jgi:hypothetical protein
MKKISLTLAILGILAVTGFVLISSVSAADFFPHKNFNEDKMEIMAERFNLDPADISNALEQGTLKGFLEENDIELLQKRFGKGKERMLSAKAEILGMGEEELIEAHQNCLNNLLEEKGITQEEFQEKMHNLMQQKALEGMQEQGLSEEEIQTRLQRMQTRQNEGPRKGFGFFNRF